MINELIGVLIVSLLTQQIVNTIKKAVKLRDNLLCFYRAVLYLFFQG